MSSLVLTLRETLRYRGAVGQWSWVLHRITGLGVVFFLVLHVIDTSWSVFYPELYERAIAAYQSPLFTLGEFGLVACVVYHAYNGLRIAILDYRPELWKYQKRAVAIVLGLTLITLVPTFILMFGDVLEHYSSNPFILPLSEVLLDQLPFAAGMAIAVVAALVFAGLAGLFVGSGDTRATTPSKATGSRMERFWWSYMRVSGVLIIPLIFGHLAMMHVLQGVFNLTASGGSVIGTDVTNAGAAVGFVAARWNYLLAGVAIWKLYDVALLALVTIHGFNGLRYVLTDYTMFNPTLRRAAIYLCLIGAATLLVLGAGALLGTITPAAVDLANNARQAIVGG